MPCSWAQAWRTLVLHLFSNLSLSSSPDEIGCVSHQLLLWKPALGLGAAARPRISARGEEPACPPTALKVGFGWCSPGNTCLLQLLTERCPAEAAVAALGFLCHFSSSTSDVHRPGPACSIASCLCFLLLDSACLSYDLPKPDMTQTPGCFSSALGKWWPLVPEIVLSAPFCSSLLQLCSKRPSPAVPALLKHSPLLVFS